MLREQRNTADHALRSAVEAFLGKAVQANPLDGFRLWLEYEHGIEGILDLSDLAGRARGSVRTGEL